MTDADSRLGATAGDAVAATVGVEEEFHLVDPVTGGLAPKARRIVRTPAEVQPELHRSQIETASRVHRDMDGLRRDLATRRGDLAGAARGLGLAIVSSGTVPASGTPADRVFPKPRYQWMAQEYRQLVDEQQVCACQIQIGVPDRDLAVRVARRIQGRLHVLLALSAGSPMFQNVDTGYASYRTVAISRWPTVGPLPALSGAKEYDELVGALVGSGVISDAGMIYFDARPSARYPTVEIRIADACPLLDDVILLAVLGRALVAAAAREDEAGQPLPDTRTVLLRAATWRAARSGLDGDLVDPLGGTAVPANRAVRALMDYLRPDLENHGDWQTANDLLRALLRRGTSAQRQRAVLKRGGSLTDVVDAVIRETETG
ncbi:carboxylate-amine ligase [Rugosimonospora africana]|uniref:carboxylate-amine ligase n=1 Tax=Rugosimonospora africana TaxID=556532 RepID=UPI00194189CA|nr:glutamate--cysteine ligase [Rugosimonospora africana]